MADDGLIPAHGGYLLDQLLRQLESAFLKEDGLREHMTRARLRSLQP